MKDLSWITATIRLTWIGRAVEAGRIKDYLASYYAAVESGTPSHAAAYGAAQEVGILTGEEADQ